MPIGPQRMPFFEHLDELRKRLGIIAAVIFIGSLALYGWAWEMYDWFMAPIIKIFGGQPFVTLNPFENFTLRFKISLYATLVIFSPIIIWQVFAFFLPALRAKERKWVLPTFAAMASSFAKWSSCRPHLSGWSARLAPASRSCRALQPISKARFCS